MDFENINDDYFQENDLPSGDRMDVGGTNMEILTRVELELAFASDKLLNLEMLVMEIARQATEFEPPTLENGSVSSETAEDAFQLDILYGILDGEVQELDNFICSLQTDTKNVEHKICEEESGGKLKAKLDTAMTSLKQMQDLIADIRKESAKFEKPIEFSSDQAGIIEFGGCENGHISSHIGMRTEDQRRNVLQMLEQSIASELDLEKKLSDSRSLIEELKLKLRRQEQETYLLGELTETISGRMFAAENASELLLGTSRELQNSLDTSTPELSFLRQKVQELEKHLTESGSQLLLANASAEASLEQQNVLRSEISTLESIIQNLKDDVSRAESRAQNAEERCMQLTQANVELNGELSSHKSDGSDKASLLEKKLNESSTQLEHAKASLDAIVEHQSMLRSTISDMEQMIEDLKGKVSKAETRAENAESKYTLLTHTNLELSEELSFLRSGVESLENSLHEANHVKISTVKDIGIRTKIITDLVTRLALERERLHLQIATLTNKNKILVQKCKGSVKDAAKLSKNATGKDVELQFTKLAEDPDSSSSKNEMYKEEAKNNSSEGEDSAGEGTLETVRTIEPSLLNWKYIAVAFLVSLTVVLVYLVQKEDRSAAFASLF